MEHCFELDAQEQTLLAVTVLRDKADELITTEPWKASSPRRAADYLEEHGIED